MTKFPTCDPCEHGIYPGSPIGPCPICKMANALKTIRANAMSQIDGMNSMGVPDDAPERIAAIWYYTEATAALSA